MEVHESCRVRYAESLSEIYQHIYNISAEISASENNKEARPFLWFRGHANADYNLNPNIFREADYHYNLKETYSNNHLREDYRFQNFMSRNFDNVNYHMPQSVIEWQEVMQHYFAKTRLMDWSESLTVALEFALEAFINPVKDKEIEERRRTSEPAIWILRPDKLNKEVYKSFLRDEGQLIRKALGEEVEATRLDLKIKRELSREEDSGIYYNLPNETEKNMNAMISLSSLEIIRNAYKGREKEALRSFEMNPFFYLLLRYYSDGIPVAMGKIPPLAIIHPYHSERIKTQKGVFTVFPYYIPDIKMKRMKEILETYPPVAMEYMGQCIPYLYKIHIVNPQRVANELLITGAKRGNLYPDMQIISQDMENVVD